jgi:hypothetical protein
MVSGYTTGRVHVRTTGVSGLNNLTVLTLTNSGPTQFSMRVDQTDDSSVSGVRTELTSVTLVPSGQATKSISPTQPFLEFIGTSGNGTLRAQISSQLQWDIMAFDSKTDTVYPRVITRPQLINGLDNETSY